MYARAPHASQRLEVFSTSIVRTLSYCIGSWIRTNIGLIQSQGTCHLVYSDKAPGAGIEPTTFRVRAERSYLIVLAGNMSSFIVGETVTCSGLRGSTTNRTPIS